MTTREADFRQEDLNAYLDLLSENAVREMYTGMLTTMGAAIGKTIRDGMLSDVADMLRRIAILESGLREIADDPCIDSEGNKQIALKALKAADLWKADIVSKAPGA